MGQRMSTREYEQEFSSRVDAIAASLDYLHEQALAAGLRLTAHLIGVAAESLPPKQGVDDDQRPILFRGARGPSGGFISRG